MRRLILPLSFVLAGVFPLLMGWLVAGWLVNRLETAVLKGWVVGMVTAVILTLLCIAGWALYKDKIWQGLMHPLAFMGSVTLLFLALLSLPALWGQLRLLAKGETAVATVTSLSTTLDYNPDTNITNTIYHLAYDFTSASGQSHHNRIEVAQDLYKNFSEGDAMRILYLPDKPNYSLPEFVIQPERRARRILMFLWAVFGVMGETAVLMFFGKNTPCFD